MKQNKSFISCPRDLSPRLPWKEQTSQAYTDTDGHRQDLSQEQQPEVYDVQYTYSRIRTQDHLVFLLQKCCDAVIHRLLNPKSDDSSQTSTDGHQAACPLDETTGSLLRGSRFIVKEQLRSHIFTLCIDTSYGYDSRLWAVGEPRRTTIWDLLREICNNTPFRSDEIHQTVTDHENWSRGLKSRDPKACVLLYAMVSLKRKLQNFYLQIHVYRPLVQTMAMVSSEQLFVDIYRNNLYCSQLCRNIVTPLRQKKRSRSCEVNRLVCNPAQSVQSAVEAESMTVSSDIVSILSGGQDESCMQALREVVCLLQGQDTQQPGSGDHGSAVSQDGSDTKEDYPERGNEITIMLDYFKGPVCLSPKDEHIRSMTPVSIQASGWQARAPESDHDARPEDNQKEQPAVDEWSDGSSFVVVSDA